MALRISGVKFLPPERTYSSLQIGKFPFAYRGLKIIPDFQRESNVFYRFLMIELNSNRSESFVN